MNINDWYWYVGGDETQVYSSAAQGYVPVDDAAFLSWLGRTRARPNGDKATRIASESDLFDELKRRGREDLLPSSDAARQVAEAVEGDADTNTLEANMLDKTPAQVRAWVQSNMTNIAEAQDIVSRLIIKIIRLERKIR